VTTSVVSTLARLLGDDCPTTLSDVVVEAWEYRTNSGGSGRGQQALDDGG
jgi:hypothetical protein